MQFINILTQILKTKSVAHISVHLMPAAILQNYRVSVTSGFCSRFSNFCIPDAQQYPTISNRSLSVKCHLFAQPWNRYYISSENRIS